MTSPRFARPLDRGAEVVRLGGHCLWPMHAFVLERQVGRLRLSEEEVSMAPCDRRALSGRLESLDGELPDRLQHPEAAARSQPNEALVDERLQRVELGRGDRLRGLERAAAAKDR
jgi:hypothetical protein